MKLLKTTSYIFAVLAGIFLLLAIMVAIGVLGGSNGLLDLSNMIAIGLLAVGFFCSIIASTTALIYKTKNRRE